MSLKSFFISFGTSQMLLSFPLLSIFIIWNFLGFGFGIFLISLWICGLFALYEYRKRLKNDC